MSLPASSTDARLSGLLTQLQSSSTSSAAQSHSHSHSHAHDGDADAKQIRSTIRRILTTRDPAVDRLSESTLSAIDVLLAAELSAKSVTRAEEMRRIQKDGPLGQISLWRGDITTLSCDAIVNAANTRMLGCFQPSHRCIDNVIHEAAGPRLREECYRIITHKGKQEEVGQCIITPAYSMPSRFVLHTAGPQLDRSIQTNPTVEQEKQLISSYTTCLDAADQNGSITSVAFCCISTGLFGYPPRAAARVAVDSTLAWLGAHPESKVAHVIFNVFLESDQKIYEQIFESMKNEQRETNVTPDNAHTIPASMIESLRVAQEIVQETCIPPVPISRLTTPVGVDPASLATALSWFDSADSLLLCGGAGVSAAAGLDYVSTDVCGRLLPNMAQHGFRRFYQAIGKSDWCKELQWGYQFAQVYLARFHWPKSQLYQQLLSLARTRPKENSFVYTTNVDGMFAQNGFPADRVYNIQGDYAYLQCLTPCSQDSYWPSLAVVERALPHIDSRTQYLPSEFHPVCPNCGGPAFFNVRGGGWFIDDAIRSAHRIRYQQFMHDAIDRATPEAPLVIIEIGSGFNTPGVIRFPMDRLALRHASVRLIRINEEYPDVPPAIAGVRAVGLEGSAAEIINFIHQKSNRTNKEEATTQ